MNLTSLIASSDEVNEKETTQFFVDDLSTEIITLFDAMQELTAASEGFERVDHYVDVLSTEGLTTSVLKIIDRDGEMNEVFEAIGADTVSTESIDETPNMEAATVAAEGFKETAKKVGSKIADIIKKMIDAIKDFFERWFSSVGRMEAALKKLKDKKSDIESANEKNFGKKKVKALKKSTFDKVSQEKFAGAAIGSMVSEYDKAKSIDEVKKVNEKYSSENIEKAHKKTLKLMKGDDDKGGGKKDDVSSLGWKPKDVAGALSTAENALKEARNLEKQKKVLEQALASAEKEARGLERVGNEDEYKLLSAKVSGKRNALKAFTSAVTKEATIHSTVASTVINLGKAALGTSNKEDK